MDLKNVTLSTKEQIEPGEEKLHDTKNFVITKGKRMSVLLGVDGGSTQVRVLAMSSKGFDEEDICIVPSNFGIVPDDRTILPKTTKVYDNLDTTLIDIRGKQETMFDKVRAVRGTKLKDTNLGEKRIDSATQKIENPSFYTNIVDAIGYALAFHCGDDIPEFIEAYLGVALPPDDVSSEKNTKLFKDRLVGKYKWKLNSCADTVEIDIKAVEVKTEPEAFIKAYYSVEEDEDGLPELCLHINGGGRSIGVELLENGTSVSSASRTLAYGGTQLQDKLGNNFIQSKGGRMPNYSALGRALKTGTLKNGGDYTNVVELVKKTKDQFASDIVTDIIAQVFDQQTRFTLTDVDEISVSGKLFDKGEYDYSLAVPVKKEFALKTPKTRFKHIGGNFIPLGLLLEVYGKFGGIIEQEESEVALELGEVISEE